MNEQGDSSKVVIIEPGIVEGIDGKKYWNKQRIVAGSPTDVRAYHEERAKLFNAIYGGKGK